MLKVDIHTHIIPDNLPDFTKKFGYEGFVRLDKKNESEGDMILFNENFRTINCNCWNPKVRLNEMEKSKEDNLSSNFKNGKVNKLINKSEFFLNVILLMLPVLN